MSCQTLPCGVAWVRWGKVERAGTASLCVCRPPTARTAAPMQQASQAGSGLHSQLPSAQGPSLLARDCMAESCMPGRSSTTFPPHPSPSADLVRQSTAAPARSSEAPALSSNGGSGRGPSSGSVLQMPPHTRVGSHGRPAPLAAGLSTWAQLQDAPPSRRTTGTPAPVLPSLPQSRNGSARRRSSWAGLFGLGGGAAELPPGVEWQR